MNASHVIERLPSAFLPDVAGNADAIFQFEVEEPCYLTIKEGKCSFTSGRAESPSLTLTAADDVLAKVLTGQMNGMMAVMTGKMKTKGNLTLGQSMTTFFDLDALSTGKPAKKAGLLKRLVSKVLGDTPKAETQAPQNTNSEASGCPFHQGATGSDGGFVDKLLYIDIPIDPPGDPRCPYPEWAERREKNRVEIEADRFGEDAGTLAYLYGHAEVVECLHNNEDFSSTVMQNMFTGIMGDHLMLGMDEPEHAQYRNLVAPALRPKLLLKWEETLIHAVVDELIAKIKAKGNKADLVADFTFAYPARVVGQVIGLPQSDFEKFQDWAVGILEGVADPDKAAKCALEVRAYLAPFLEARRIDPREDMISELVHAEIDGEKLSDEEIYSFLLLLLPAGIETTYRALGSMLFHLLSNPDQLNDVRNDRKLVGKALEETLRVDPPIQLTPRIAIRESKIGETTIPEGCIVIPLLAAANRDPEFIDDANRFNIHRSPLRHITFGNGVHTCIGLHLARLEIKIALNSLLDAMPGLRFDEEEFTKRDAHIRGKSFRSPTAIPVMWDED